MKTRESSLVCRELESLEFKKRSQLLAFKQLEARNAVKVQSGLFGMTITTAL